jgi:hypothetical protein
MHYTWCKLQVQTVIQPGEVAPTKAETSKCISKRVTKKVKDGVFLKPCINFKLEWEEIKQDTSCMLELFN